MKMKTLQILTYFQAWY